jgi:hypothetical protein
MAKTIEDMLLGPASQMNIQIGSAVRLPVPEYNQKYALRYYLLYIILAYKKDC